MKCIRNVLLIAAIVFSAGEAQSQSADSGNLYPAEKLKCVLKNLPSYLNWIRQQPEEPVGIPLKICPYTSMTPGAITLLQQDQPLSFPRPLPPGTIHFILVVMKSELICLERYRLIIENSQPDKYVSLPKDLCASQ